MFKVPRFLFLFLALVVSFVLVNKTAHYQKDQKRRVRQEKLAHPVALQKSFVIVIRSYNNADWYEKNLRSVFEQKYDNYRVIYIDDASKDHTSDLVKSYIAKMGKEEKVSLIRNENNLGASANLYFAAHSCSDGEIIVLLDGDDWLAHDEVLKKLNEVYADPNVWMTYGSYVTYPAYERGVYARELPEKVVQKNQIRKFVKNELWPLSALATFYAELYKEIRLRDCLFEGRFFDAAADVAFMVPLAEMAGRRAKYLDEVLYIYNRATALNDDKLKAKRQFLCSRHVVAQKPYKPLEALPKHVMTEGDKADLVIFSFDRPMPLLATLESIAKFVVGVDKISVIYRSSDPLFEVGYQRVRECFKDVVFIKQGDSPHEDFKPLLLSTVYNGGAQYVVFAVDENIVTDQIDLTTGAAALQMSKAHGFYYRLGKHIDSSYVFDLNQGIPPLNVLSKQVLAWNFSQGKGDWRFPNNVEFTLYDKKNIEKNLRSLQYKHPRSLESQWSRKHKINKVGLCYDSAKIINIPLCCRLQDCHMMYYSSIELLEKFQTGLKIDISPLYQIKSRTTHVEFNPHFVAFHEDLEQSSAHSRSK